MVLVERLRVTGVEVQSYGTDAALLGELRASWPPAGAAAGNAGFTRVDLGTLSPAAAIRLTDRLGVALAAEPKRPAGSFASVPVVLEGSSWRRGRPGDGISAFVAGAPMASERSIGVDQTHDSVVVGERAIVKWFRHVGPGPSRAATLLAHLAEVDFGGIPAPLGSLAWRSPSGVDLTLAQGDAYLPGARDGWEWCLDLAESGDASVGGQLGELVAGLHQALATPSSILREPVGRAGREEIGRWRAQALATLDDAVAATPGTDLPEWEPAMRAALDGMAARSVPIQPVHGDLHVGQVLEWPGGRAVIDFDGNPALPEAANAVLQPPERDVAQMLTSLDHLGRVVEERGGGDRSTWIADARSGFLAAVGRVDERLIEAFEVEQECRELVYAARFLPRWRYAPMATLRARFG